VGTDERGRRGVDHGVAGGVARVRLVGDWGRSFHLLAGLYDAGIELVPDPDGSTPGAAPLALVALDDDAPTRPGTGADGHGHPAAAWLAWNRDDSGAAAVAAYRAGAVAVLPAATTAAQLRDSVEHALARAGNGADPAGRGERRRRFRRGALIALERDAVLEVEAGVVAVTVVHDDGAEVLLGLHGPGETLVGHGPDGCGIRLLAHTETEVVLRRWTEASGDIHFPSRLAARLRRLEAWAAMQARPYLDQRLLGLLGLLAEQFGKPHPAGTVVDVRVTHAQLAAAVGATRTTVTRLLGELRARSLVTTVGAGAAERFCLPDWDRHHAGRGHD